MSGCIEPRTIPIRPPPNKAQTSSGFSRRGGCGWGYYRALGWTHSGWLTWKGRRFKEDSNLCSAPSQVSASVFRSVHMDSFPGSAAKASRPGSLAQATELLLIILSYATQLCSVVLPGPKTTSSQNSTSCKYT